MIYLLILIIFAGIILFLWMIKEAFLNRVLKEELQFPDFPSSFEKVSIFFISDIHRRCLSEKIITEVKGKADLVIIGGDLTEKGVPMERVKENIKKLSSIATSFFVWGNNDYEVDTHWLEGALSDAGIKILNNTAVVFESKARDKINLLGVNDITLNKDRLDQALIDAEKNSFKILACHNPQIIKKVTPEHGISLILSGHTHGGQIRIFGFGPYERGKIKKTELTTLLVSNGYGTTTVPLRLGAPAECHLITLKKK